MILAWASPFKHVIGLYGLLDQSPLDVKLIMSLINLVFIVMVIMIVMRQAANHHVDLFT